MSWLGFNIDWDWRHTWRRDVPMPAPAPKPTAVAVLRYRCDRCDVYGDPADTPGGACWCCDKTDRTRAA